MSLIGDGAPDSSAALPATPVGQAIARAGLILGVAFLASRLLGWARLAVIGATFGASPDLDAYFAAFRIPDAIFQLVAAGALSSALVPMVTSLLAGGDVPRAWRLVSSVTNLMLLVLAALAVAAGIWAPELLRAITPGFDPARLEQAVGLTRLMLAAPVFLALGAVATSSLNSLGLFAASALAPIAYNLGIIAGAVLLAPSLGVTGLALGVVLGSAGHLAIQLPQLRRRARYSPTIELGDPAVRQTIGLLVPRAIGLGAVQAVFLVNTMLASQLGEGAISIYVIAFLILQIPVGVVGVPLGVALLPSMARALTLGSPERFADLVGRSLRLILFVMLPLGAVMAVLRVPIVGLLVGYGRFDPLAFDRAAATLLFFLVALVPETMIAVLARAFYAGKDTLTPVLAALASVVVDVVLALFLVDRLGLGGLALAIGLGSCLEAGLLLLLLRRRVAEFELAPVGRSGVVFAGGTVLAAGVAWLASSAAGAAAPGPGLERLVFQLGAATVLAGLAYALYALVLRVPELSYLVDLLRGGRLFRRSSP